MNDNKSEKENSVPWEEFIKTGTEITWQHFFELRESLLNRDAVFCGPFGCTWRGPIKKTVLTHKGWQLTFGWIAEMAEKSEWLLVSCGLDFSLVGRKDMTKLGDVHGTIRMKFLDKPCLRYIQKGNEVTAVDFRAGIVKDIPNANYAAILPAGQNLQRPDKGL